jgi:hypothetical protein
LTPSSFVTQFVIRIVIQTALPFDHVFICVKKRKLMEIKPFYQPKLFIRCYF